MMKIRTISVYGLFGRHDHTVNVFDDGITYIHSPNGCGKSTLIRMVSLLFAGDKKNLSKIPFERMDISFSDGTNVIVENENELFIQMQRNEITSELSSADLRSIVKINFISPERTFTSGTNGCMTDAVGTYADELSDMLIAAKDARASALPKITETEDDELVSLSKDLNAKLNFMRGAGFDIDIPPGSRFPPTRYDLTESKDEYIELVSLISDFVERNHYLSESVVVFKDVINNFLSDKEMMIDDQNNIVFILDNGVALPLNYLSSGEKHIFV
ncbi:MAG: AAA family ATPase, partial [Methanomassiliicoccaceae archaeon]|nr:AAA family ATPase [Methanomassiliicoccaceae archaeon]